MPVIPQFLRVDELPLAQTAKPFDLVGAREYQRQFLVEMNDRQVGTETAVFAPGLPLPLASYINPFTGFLDLLSLCIKISSKRDTNSDGAFHIVTCDYSTNTGRVGNPANFGYPRQDGGPQGMENHPEMESPELDWDTEEVLVPALTDLDDKPFANSALDQVDPAPVIPYQRTILSLTRNELNYNCVTAGLFAGSVNDSTFAGYPKDAVLCMAPKAKLVFKGPLGYYRVTYKLKFGYKKELVQQYNPDGTPATNLDGTIKYADEYESFQYVMLDAGYQERLKESELILGGDSSIYRKRPIVDRNGAPIRSPVLLNGSGRKQIFVRSVAGVDVPIQTYTKFRTRRRLNFTDLFVRGLGVAPPP